MIKKILFVFSVVICLTSVLEPKAEAIDPVTMSLLAPYAMPVAEAAAQYAIKGMVNSVPGFIDIGKDIFSIFLLPVGVLECTLGAPFGLFGPGLEHVVGGVEGPFKLVFDILTLPLRAIAGK